MTAVEEDLNTVIASAVNARIESAVLAALASDDVFAQYVQRAMRQTVEVPSRDGGYRKDKVAFIDHVLHAALKAAIEAAVGKVVVEQQDAIEKAVAAALRRRTKEIAELFTNSIVDSAQKAYGVRVEIAMPKSDY